MSSLEYETGIGGSYEQQNGIGVNANEIDYPFVPCEGAPFHRADNGNTITLSEIAALLNDPEQQEEACEGLGIHIESNVLEIRFTESGKAYVDDGNDRTQAEEEETSYNFNFDFHFIRNIHLPLHVKVELDGYFQENVNFLGRVIVKDDYVIPLTGRGTAALEGKQDDCHAGFCTGGACASFQERVALVYGISLAAGAKPRDLRRLATEFITINEKYHGRRDILDYTLECCLNQRHQVDSYRAFMLKRGEVSSVMEPLLKEPNAVPGPEYFAKVRAKLTQAELQARMSSEIPAVEEDLHPVIPRHPKISESVSLDEFAEMLCTGSRQPEALKLLGFEVSDNEAELSFKETGCAYSQPDVDRQLVNEFPSDAEFNITMRRSEGDEEERRLPLEIELGGWNQNNVNFLGMVRVTLGEDVFSLPLTGRGTAALEGRKHDAHAGFCTGGACAAFQVRASLCLAVARAIGASNDDIRALGEELHSINKMFHGRDDILEYTIHCALVPNAESYLAFMTSRYQPGDRRFPLLQAMRTTGKPNRGYFEALHKKFTAEELDDERARRDSYQQQQHWCWSWVCCPFFLS